MWQSSDKNITTYLCTEMNNSQYHSIENTKKYLSSSGIKKLLVSPLHYKQYLIDKENPEKNKTTEALLFGNHFHHYCNLKVMTFNKDNEWTKLASEVQSISETTFPINPTTGKPYGMDTKKAEDWLMINKVAKEQIISEENKEIINTMTKNLFSHKQTKRFILNAIPEFSIFIEKFPYGVDQNGNTLYIPVKVRLDIKNFDLQNKKLIISDYKTCQSEVPEKDEFIKMIINRKYHVQGALYVDVTKLYIKEMYGIELSDFDCLFYLIPIEKVEPYDFSYYPLSIEAIEIGRYEYKVAFERYQKAIETNNWDGYEKDIENFISLPKWYNHAKSENFSLDFYNSFID